MSRAYTKLEQIGRQVIANRVYQRRKAERDRRVLKIVQDCVSDPAISGESFRARLVEEMRKFEDHHQNMDVLIQEAIEKL